jgi:hypothetical protein
MLTEEEIIAYIENPIPKCPYCGTRDIVGESVEINSSAAYQEVVCQVCEKRWLDLYKLFGIEEEGDPNGNCPNGRME